MASAAPPLTAASNPMFRKEETGQHLDHLDGWRGLAVLAVLFGHFWGDENLWSGTSSLGVELFFVLSGRLMAEILFVRRSPILTFFSRRVSRIFPALVVFVFVTTLVFQSTDLSHGGKAIAVALTMTLNYAMVYSHAIGLLDHLWSLCVEEHAYIILAGFALLNRIRGFRVAGAIAALGFLAMINGIIRLDLLGHDALETHWRTDVSIAGIFVAAALWLQFRNVLSRSWVSPVAFFVAVICEVQEPALLNLGAGTLALAVGVVALDAAPAIIRRVLSSLPLKTVGLWSYSLYLWQQPFYKLYQFEQYPLILALAGTLVAALASFYLIERPSRLAINRRFDQFRLRPSN